jgi:hypothetical protein
MQRHSLKETSRAMAGHSKFKNIMHRKGRADAVRSKLFSRLSREITVAAKSGLPDPTMPEGAEALRGGVADLPPADPIRPRRTDTGGRGEAPQGPLAALPPPPPAVPAPDRPGERTPTSARSSAAPPSRGAAVEPPAPRQPASPRCAAILARLQLGETPSHADRLHLQTICAPRP